MSLVFRSLRIENFRSFRREASLPLVGTGLTYVAGRNEVEPDLGANGAGKSSLFEALFWCLFGKTSRNLRAGDVAPWDSDDTVLVEASFAAAGEEYVLLRTWRPVGLSLSTGGGAARPVDQAEVEAALGYDAETFLYAVFHAQFVPAFADLTPSQQLAVYSKVVRLDVWSDAGDLVAKKARALEKEVHSLDVTLAEMRGRLRALADEIDALESCEIDTLRQRNARLRTLHAGAAKLRAKGTSVPELDLTDLKVALAAVVHKETSYENGIGVQHKAIAAKRAEISRLETQATSLEDKMMCPTCFGVVDAKHAEHVAAGLIAASRRELKELHTTLSSLEARLARMRKVRGKLEAECESVTKKHARKTEAAQQRKNQLVALEAEIAAVLSVVTDFRSSARRGEYERSLEAYAKQRAAGDEARHLLAIYEFWSKAFKELRLLLINETLAHLEVSTNSALHGLGMQDWSVEYAIDHETKGGKVVRGFSILVTSPHNDAPVPFEAWSGGESQRLRLAVALGLSDLIQDYTGLRSNVEVFDEPTAWLSDDGIESLLSVLARRAGDLEREIFLIDHRALDYGGFTRIVLATKDEHGTTLQEG